MEESHKKWIYLWKAVRNHNEENPSHIDYTLLDFRLYLGENYKDLSQEEIEQRLAYIVEEWAEHQSGGESYGYRYGFDLKAPPQEWLEREIRSRISDIERRQQTLANLQQELITLYSVEQS